MDRVVGEDRGGGEARSRCWVESGPECAAEAACSSNALQVGVGFDENTGLTMSSNALCEHQPIPERPCWPLSGCVILSVLEVGFLGPTQPPACCTGVTTHISSITSVLTIHLLTVRDIDGPDGHFQQRERSFYPCWMYCECAVAVFKVHMSQTLRTKITGIVTNASKTSGLTRLS